MARHSEGGSASVKYPIQMGHELFRSRSARRVGRGQQRIVGSEKHVLIADAIDCYEDADSVRKRTDGIPSSPSRAEAKLFVDFDDVAEVASHREAASRETAATAPLEPAAAIARQRTAPDLRNSLITN